MTRVSFAPHPLAAAVVIAGALLGPGRAAAQSTVDAEVLFQEGKRLLKEGKIAAACDKLEASERIESTVGVLLNVADCREKNHQLASAWGMFLKAAASARRAGNDASREKEARRRAEALAPRLSYLTISVPDSSKVEGLTIMRRGQPIDPALWNQGVPVDIGEYEISASAPGHDPWTTKVMVAAEGSRAVIEVPRFKRLEDLASPPRAPVVSVTAGPSTPSAEADAPGPTAPGRFTTLRKVGVGAAVVGLVAAGGGVVFAMKSSDLRGQADEICPTAACGDPRGVSLNEDAKSAALTANLLFVAGGVAVAGAVACWFLGAPDSSGASDQVSARPVVAPGSFGFAVSGRF